MISKLICWLMGHVFEDIGIDELGVLWERCQDCNKTCRKYSSFK